MSEKFEEMLMNAGSSQEKMKLFAQALAKAEAELTVQPVDILINGIIRDDQFVARFDVSKDSVADVIEHFLSYRRLNPDIIVNGIPAEDLRSISVSVGKSLGR